MNTVVQFATPSVTNAGAPNRALRWEGLACTLICALPAAGCLMAGKLTLAANSFWVLLALIMAGLMFAGQNQLLISVLVGVIPLLNLLRGQGFVFFNAPLVVMIVGLAYYFLRVPGSLQQTYRHYRSAAWLGALAGVYYILSVIGSGEYTRNLRFFELFLGVLCMLVAARSRNVLGSGLMNFIASSCLIGLAMLPHNRTIGRLGMIVIQGTSLGNPVQLGMALAVSFLVLTVDRGQWLNWPGSGSWRWLLFVPTAALLALTTSRAAWLVSITGLLVAVLLGRKQRLRILLKIVAVAVVLLVTLQTSFGPSLWDGLNRTFNSDRSIGNRTSGRSDQWAVAYAAATDSWERTLWGYGPGKGGAVYARFSGEVEGVRYNVGRRVDLHSLFMQVMVETGLVGMVPLVVMLLVLGFRSLRWSLATGWMLPAVCICGYLLSVCTVAGTGLVDGLLLGFAFCATAPARS